MFRRRFICLAAAIACLTGICAAAGALEVDSDSVYCFTTGDFSQEEDELTGICITGLPDASTGTVMLGSRVLRSGDILAADQIAQMTFAALNTEVDQEAVITYLPIYENRVAAATTMTVSVKGKINQAPVAEDFAMETYKNLPNDGKLKATDPEGGKLTYTVTRQPKRGTVEIREDGSFTYTPKKNKVGVDSFVFTATDSAGKVSREATVTIRILKPVNSTLYTDTVGSECRFAAEWMKNTGLFVGEKIGSDYCFNEDKPVCRGEFLAMMIKTLDIPVEGNTEVTGYTDETPSWLKPYLAAALRSGLTAGLPSTQTGVFGAYEPITGGEVAVLLQNAMDLTVTTSADDLGKDDSDMVWATGSVAAMNQNGIILTAGEVMTRGQVAQILYQVSQMAEDAPGLSMYQ